MKMENKQNINTEKQTKQFSVQGNKFGALVS